MFYLEGNEINIIDVIDTGERSFLDTYILKKDIETLYECINTILTDREKEIIIMRYGLFNNREVTQREIACRMGISRSYVSRIEKEALLKLRKYFVN